jgi:hypothetical protein
MQTNIKEFNKEVKKLNSKYFIKLYVEKKIPYSIENFNKFHVCVESLISEKPKITEFEKVCTNFYKNPWNN